MSNKSLFKRIGAIALALALTLSLSVTAFAADNISTGNMNDNTASKISENFGGLMDDVVSCSERYGIANFDFSSFELLQPINIVDVSDNSNTDASIVHLPITDDAGNIVLIFDIITTNNGVTCTLGTDFAPLLNAVKASGSDTVLLLQDGYSLYAVSDNGVYVQNGQTISLADSQNELSQLPAVLDSNANLYELNNVNNDYTQLATASLALARENNIVAPADTAVTGSRSLSNYPIVDQCVDGEQYGLCWAATVASIVRFEKPSTYGSLTAQNVADYMKIGYDDGGTNSESKEALEHYLGSSYSPTIKNSVLSTAEIKSTIDGTDPAYLQCRRPNGFLSYKYHAVALCGYNFTSSSTKIEIMDPAYECFKDCTYSGGDWTFAFGTYTYTWIKTIRIK